MCDEICTKGDNKHAKCEAKVRLNHKYYWVHKEEDMLFNGRKAFYNILNIQDKVTMKHFYHIRLDTDLDKGFYDMRLILCAFTGCVEQLSKPWLPNLDKTSQPRYDIKPETCNYSSNLRGYNKLYTSYFNF